ncbi:MAG: arsenate reductase ArsC [Actinomycetota bacterium]|nr:arsenate reductase ArsC [Actinomycetota bacterium]
MKPKIAFICIGNSCRSQMAEGFAKKYVCDYFDIFSAGTEPAETVNPLAISVMKEKNIDISNQKTKPLKDIPVFINYIITMGCGVSCPFIPHDYQEDWELDDPVGRPIEEFRKTRDLIENKLNDFLLRFKNNNFT